MRARLSEGGGVNGGKQLGSCSMRRMNRKKEAEYQIKYNLFQPPLHIFGHIQITLFILMLLA